MGRRLGQHFLRDIAILDRIVDAIAPAADDTVLEIGPGDGTLTMRLLRRVARVVAIERDPGLAAGLHGRDRLTVVTGDALEVPWPERTKVIGNVPYYITTPLIEKALTPPARPVTVFLVQKEVADRVVALPGGKAYGALSVGVQAVALAERLFVIRAGAFHPPPKVDSADCVIPLIDDPKESRIIEQELTAIGVLPVSSYVKHLQHLVAVVVDDLHGDLA